MLRIETFTGPAWQWEGLAPVNLSLVPMASTPPARLKRDAPRGSEGRHPPLHILFVHSHIAEVERCLKVLDKLHFTVSAEVVATPEEFTERLCRGAYDLVVAEHPSPNWRERQALELLHLSNRQIPLIFTVAPCNARQWRTSLQKAPTTVSKWTTLVIFPSPFIELWMRKHCAMTATEPKMA